LKSIIAVVGIVGALHVHGAAAQDPVDRALDTAERAQRDAAASQKRIDQLDDQTRALLERYRAATWQAQQLTVFAEQLEAIAERQEEEKASLRRQIDAMQRTEAELMPLMLRMLDTFEALIERDLPFLETERQERLTQVTQLMSDPEASLAQKYRRLLEAYQIEIDYGQGLDAERGQVGERTIDILRVGRLALYGLTLDGREAFRWDREAGEWQPADSGLRRTIRQGLRMARDTAPIALMKLPVEAPVDVGAIESLEGALPTLDDNAEGTP